MTSRTCFGCNGTFPLSSNYFYHERSRPGGFGYECKTCQRQRKAGRDRSKELVANLSPEQHQQRIVVKRRYHDASRSKRLVRQYQKFDAKRGLENDIDLDWFNENIAPQSCFYCDEVGPSGCDRIDNSRGHLQDNVIPACGSCNLIRGNRLTVGEMWIVGQKLAHFRRLRDTPSC